MDALGWHSLIDYREQVHAILRFMFGASLIRSLQVPRNSASQVVVLPQQRNSLNNRWLIPDSLLKTEAVLVFDDDIWLEVHALECLFSHWQKNRNRLVSAWVRRYVSSS